MIEEGKDPPKAFFDRPELPDHLHFYWSAFNDLSSDRQIGMGIGPIPYSSIRAYATEYNVRGRDEFDYFFNLIQAMDIKYMAHANRSDKSKDLVQVPVDNVEEQHLLFKRLATRAKEAKKPLRK